MQRRKALGEFRGAGGPHLMNEAAREGVGRTEVLQKLRHHHALQQYVRQAHVRDEPFFTKHHGRQPRHDVPHDHRLFIERRFKGCGTRSRHHGVTGFKHPVAFTGNDGGSLRDPRILFHRVFNLRAAGVIDRRNHKASGPKPLKQPLARLKENGGAPGDFTHARPGQNRKKGLPLCIQTEFRARGRGVGLHRNDARQRVPHVGCRNPRLIVDRLFKGKDEKHVVRSPPDLFNALGPPRPNRGRDKMHRGDPFTP